MHVDVIKILDIKIVSRKINGMFFKKIKMLQLHVYVFLNIEQDVLWEIFKGCNHVSRVVLNKESRYKWWELN